MVALVRTPGVQGHAGTGEIVSWAVRRLRAVWFSVPFNFQGVKGMLGLATVLTEQGMEGVVPFVPPAPARTSPKEPVMLARVDEVSEIGLGTRILVGLIVAVMLASGVGYWVSLKTVKSAPPKTATTGIIQDMSVAPPGASDADTPRAQPDRASAPASAAVEPQQPPQTTAPRAESPPTTRNPAKAAARQSEPSVFVPNPAWSSQVRRVGDVDPVTERSTMVILDAIQDVQERERQARPAASKEGGRER